MPNEKTSTTEQTSNELNLFIDQGDAVIRGLATCALRGDGDSTRSMMRAAGSLAESLQLLGELGESERRSLAEQLGARGVELVAMQADEVQGDDSDVNERMVSEDEPAGSAEALLGTRLSRPIAVVIDTLIDNPGQQFTPAELRERVGALSISDSGRTQMVLRAIDVIRSSPYASQLEVIGATRDRRYMWALAEDEVEMQAAVTIPTPKDAMGPFARRVNQEVVPAPVAVVDDAREAMPVAKAEAVVALVEGGALVVENLTPEQQRAAEFDESLRVVTERFADMPFGIDRRDDGGLLLHQNNITVKASQQVIELFVKLAAVDPNQGYAIADLVDHFCPAESGAGKDVRREHVDGKRVLFTTINSELPKLVEQLSPELELKRDKVPYRVRAGVTVSPKAQRDVGRAETSLAIVRNDMAKV